MADDTRPPQSPSLSLEERAALGPIDGYCTAWVKKRGRHCLRRAIKGGTVCPMHGGSAPQVRAAAARRVQEQDLERAAHKLGVPVPIDPGQAMLDSLASANSTMVAWQSIVRDELDLDGRLSAEARLAAAEERVARISKMCIDVGLEALRIQLTQEATESWFVKLIGVLQRFGVDTAEIRVAFANELRPGPTIDVEGEEI